MSLAQLSRMLPLPEVDLQQILDYAASLSKQEAADHFNNLLGESPQSIDFISSFNSHRQEQKPVSTAAQSLSTLEVPKPIRKPPKKKQPLHTLPPRQIQDNYATQGHAYTKQDERDYIAGKPAKIPTLQSQPTDTKAPKQRTPPSAAGYLISDPKPSSRSAPASRTSSPAPKTKINITGGTPMHGASTALTELESAIRSLEIQTNPSIKNLTKDIAARRCDCNATRHPLLTAAPNCLNCGKIICVKEGLGPCTFCRRPLLSPGEIQGMIRELREERGREKMALDASLHRRADVSKTPAPFSAPRTGGPTPLEAELGLSIAEVAMRKAQEHRDRLLGFQAQNTKRTTVRDEVAEFETPDAGTNIWGSAAERAQQLKAQQKVLREQEWNARPEYERRRQVLSLDLVGGKVVKRIGIVEKERPKEPNVGEDHDDSQGHTAADGILTETTGNGHGKGTFSLNPLLGTLIKPVYDGGKGKGVDMSGERKKKAWRRVQDDYEDNEEIILDGGIYGRDAPGRTLGDDAPSCG